MWNRFALWTFLSAATALGPVLEGEPTPAEASFSNLADEFVREHFAARPLAGVRLGWHHYDGRFVVPDQSALAAETGRLKRWEGVFAGLSDEGLSPARQHDLRLLRSAIASERWVRERQRVYSRNPMAYAGDLWEALDVSVYLKRSFKPWGDRVRDITAILGQAPRYLDVARTNLDPVLPRPFVETAIQSANGTASFLENEVSKEVETVADPTLREAYQAAMHPAVAAFRSYAAWLEAKRLTQADASFALGRDGYVQMLEAELIPATPEQILEIGRTELRAEQRRFAAAAAEIDPALPPVEVARRLQREHPTAANLVADTRKDLEAIRQFVVERRLVTLPSDVRAGVAETLPPFRATSFASMETPGPFETRATEAYYYVTPVEPSWSPQQAEEWLGSFNYYTLDVVSIHEAYPGHYVQALALNASACSPVAKAFSSYAFVEGWAHYAEQMMLEQGFGQPTDPATASPEARRRGAKYRLAQSSEALLRLCRLCCSVQLHTGGMTVKEAKRFLMENAYLEETPAASEAVRGTYDPGYLYYALGKLMILKLRRDWQAQEGTRFSLQRFHDELLSHGAPPIPLLRRLMLKDPQAWPASL